MRKEKIGIERLRGDENKQRFAMDGEQLSELAGSIRRLGLLQPLIVRAVGDEFEIVAGNRRLAACREVGMDEVDCVLLDGSEETMRESAFAENFFRADLSPLELAVAIADEYRSARMTIAQLAAGFRRSPDWIKRQIAILDWPEDILEEIHHGKVSVAALSNLAVVDDEGYRKFLLRNAVENGATARTTSQWLQAFRAQEPGQALEVAGGEAEGQPLVPAAPQGVCLSCGEMNRTDAMSHVPLCVDCIKVIRNA